MISLQTQRWTTLTPRRLVGSTAAILGAVRGCRAISLRGYLFIFIFVVVLTLFPHSLLFGMYEYVNNILQVGCDEIRVLSALRLPLRAARYVSTSLRCWRGARSTFR